MSPKNHYIYKEFMKRYLKENNSDHRVGLEPLYDSVNFAEKKIIRDQHVNNICHDDKEDIWQSEDGEFLKIHKEMFKLAIDKKETPSIELIRKYANFIEMYAIRNPILGLSSTEEMKKYLNGNLIEEFLKKIKVIKVKLIWLNDGHQFLLPSPPVAFLDFQYTKGRRPKNKQVVYIPINKYFGFLIGSEWWVENVSSIDINGGIITKENNDTVLWESGKEEKIKLVFKNKIISLKTYFEDNGFK